jgi:hypothetical protein
MYTVVNKKAEDMKVQLKVNYICFICVQVYMKIYYIKKITFTNAHSYVYLCLYILLSYIFIYININIS